MKLDVIELDIDKKSSSDHGELPETLKQNNNWGLSAILNKSVVITGENQPSAKLPIEDTKTKNIDLEKETKELKREKSSYNVVPPSKSSQGSQTQTKLKEFSSKSEKSKLSELLDAAMMDLEDIDPETAKSKKFIDDNNSREKNFIPEVKKEQGKQDPNIAELKSTSISSISSSKLLSDDGFYHYNVPYWASLISVESKEHQIIFIPLNAMCDVFCYTLNSTNSIRLGRNNLNGHKKFKAFGTLVVSRNHMEVKLRDDKV